MPITRFSHDKGTQTAPRQSSLLSVAAKPLMTGLASQADRASASTTGLPGTAEPTVIALMTSSPGAPARALHAGLASPNSRPRGPKQPPEASL